MNARPAFARFLPALLCAALLAALSVPAAAQLQIVTTTLPVGYLNVAYPASPLLASGGAAPYSYQITVGTLPAGLSFNGASGTISGVPTAAASVALTFRVTDSLSATAQRILTLTVSPPPVPGVWQPRGLFGGSIRLVVPSPDYATDAILFAAGIQGEVFRSADRGTTWTRALVDPDHAGSMLNSLVVSPVFAGGSGTVDGRTLFAASAEMAVWKSEDGGASFIKKSAGLPCNGDPACISTPLTTGLVISPDYAFDHTLWVAATVSSQPGDPFVVFTTSDGGNSWSRSSTVLGCNAFDPVVMAVAPDFSYPKNLLLSTCNKVYRSVNGGANWNYVYTIAGGGNNTVRNILYSPDFATDQTVVVEDQGGRLHRSRDGGQNFSVLPLAAAYLTVAPRAAQTPAWYYVRVPPGGGNPLPPPYNLMRSDDGLASTSPVYADGLPALTVNTLGGLYAAANSPAPDLFAGTAYGIYGSADEGASFAPREGGVSAQRIGRLAGNGPYVAACDTATAAWFKSRDTGATWTQFNSPAASFCSVIALSPDYASDRVVFIGDRFSGLYRSANDGQSFTVVLSGKEVLGLAFLPGFAGGAGTVFAAVSDGLYKSTDGGMSFSKVTTFSAPNCLTTAVQQVGSVAVSPNYASDQTLFAAGYALGSEGGLCKSVDGGATWTPVLISGLRRYGIVSLSPVYNEGGAGGTAAKTLFYNYSPYRVVRSTDGGATWSTPGLPAGVVFLNGYSVFSPNYAGDGTIFITSGYAGAGIANTQFNGLLRSTDGGANFIRLPAGDQLATRVVSGLYLPPGFTGGGGSAALASTFGSGLWLSGDSGLTFAPSTNVQFTSQRVNALARAPGGSPGVAAGLIAGSLLAATADQGVFQSDDNGLTFKQISQGLPANADARAIAVPSVSAATPLVAVHDALNAANQGLYRYDGTAWSKCPDGGSGDYTSFLDDGAYLYTTRLGGPSLRSTDGGANWQTQDPAQTDLIGIDYNASLSFTGPGARAAGPPAPGGIAAVTAGLWAVSAGGGPEYSTNNAGSWLAAPGGGDYPAPTRSGAPVDRYTTVGVLGLNAASGGREVLAGSTSDLLLSRDGGVTWRSVSGPGSGLEATSRNFAAILVTANSYGNTDVLAGAVGAATGGVYLSGDGGEHWTQINQGFDPNSLNITTLAKSSCSGCPVQYYSGTYGSGVYTRTIAVTPAPAFPSANAACFGSTGCACGSSSGSGPEAGGQPFRLCGANFQALAVVEFDGVAAAGCVTVNAGVITCAGTPPHVPGGALIRVRNPDTRTGYAPVGYSYLGGAPRNITITKITRGGAGSQDALIAWSCAGGACNSVPVQLYRSQDVAFTLHVEHYTGGTGASGTVSNTGALAPGANPTYFWSVE